MRRKTMFSALFTGIVLFFLSCQMSGTTPVHTVIYQVSNVSTITSGIVYYTDERGNAQSQTISTFPWTLTISIAVPSGLSFPVFLEFSSAASGNFQLTISEDGTAINSPAQYVGQTKETITSNIQ